MAIVSGLNIDKETNDAANLQKLLNFITGELGTDQVRFLLQLSFCILPPASDKSFDFHFYSFLDYHNIGHSNSLEDLSIDHHRKFDQRTAEES